MKHVTRIPSADHDGPPILSPFQKALPDQASRHLEWSAQNIDYLICFNGPNLLKPQAPYPAQIAGIKAYSNLRRLKHTRTTGIPSLLKLQASKDCSNRGRPSPLKA